MTSSEARSAGTGVGVRFPGDGVVVGDAGVAAVGEGDDTLGEGEGALADWTHAAMRRAATPEMNQKFCRGRTSRV
jgi:hypothetical protein